MKIGLGIDIIEKKRIKNIIKKYNIFFINKILNKKEKIFFLKTKNKIEKIAKIFTIKEAFVKAIGMGLKKNITFKKIHIIKNRMGKPKIINKNVFITISHDKNIVTTIILIKLKSNTI